MADSEGHGRVLLMTATDPLDQALPDMRPLLCQLRGPTSVPR
jgi:hypothetical protein